MVESSKAFRPIRSFVRRAGRITPAQERALKELWPRYGIEPAAAPLDFAAIFGRRAPVVLEIGFGNGAALALLASAHPANDYLGIEVHRPGVGGLLNRLAAENLKNVRVAITDAKELLACRVPDAALAAVHLWFPDPWPKKRHRKRRLVQPEFVDLVRRKLEIGGILHLATDWRDYAGHMQAVLAQVPGLAPAASALGRPVTKFETRGRRLGHEVRDFVYRRVE